MLERLLITKCEPLSVRFTDRPTDDDVRRFRVENNELLMRFLSMLRNGRQQLDRTFPLVDRTMPTSSNDATRRTLVIHRALSLLTPGTQKNLFLALRHEDREKEKTNRKRRGRTLLSHVFDHYSLAAVVVAVLARLLCWKDISGVKNVKQVRAFLFFDFTIIIRFPTSAKSSFAIEWERLSVY